MQTKTQSSSWVVRLRSGPANLHENQECQGWQKLAEKEPRSSLLKYRPFLGQGRDIYGFSFLKHNIILVLT